MNQTFQIAGRPVGGDAPCYIIAEAGSNHNRDLDLAFRLIDVAADSGADAVKFQTFSAETIATKRNNKLTKIDIDGTSSLYDLYHKLELPREWQRKLARHCAERNITFLSTPFDERAVDELEALGVEAFKVASFELNHFPLLRHIAATGKPVLLSTGMATLGEIEEALEILMDSGCRDIGLFHCGIGYPMNPAEVNLRAMQTMGQALNCPVGYSDHTLGVVVPVAAVAMGAKLYEKHFTVDNSLPGPDHGFALEPAELKSMVDAIRTAEAAMGCKLKGPALSEKSHKARACRSIYAKVTIPAGTVINADMLAILRPAAGLHPRHLSIIVGKRTVRDIESYEPITWESLME